MRVNFYVGLAICLVIAPPSLGQKAVKKQPANQAEPAKNSTPQAQPKNKGIAEEGIDPVPPVSPDRADNFGGGKTKIVVDLPHGAAVSSVAVSPDGEVVLSSGRDGTFKLWDLKSRRLLRTLSSHETRRSLAGVSASFLPDGKLLTAAGGPLQVWDMKSGALLRTIDSVSAGKISVSADGNTALLDGNVVINVSSGHKLGALDDSSLNKTSPSDPFNAGAISTDGKLAVTGGYAEGPNNDGFVRIWEVSSGRLLRTLRDHSNWVWSVAFSPDGTKVAAGYNDGTISLWNVASGALIRSWHDHDGSVDVIVFSPDGKSLASAETGDHIFSSDGRLSSPGSTVSKDAHIRLWDTATGQLRRKFEKAGAKTALVFTSDGKSLLSDFDRNFLGVWDIDSGDPVAVLPAESHVCSALKYLGPLLLAGCGGNVSVAVLDPVTGRSVRKFSGATSWVSSLAVSADQTMLMAGTGDARPHVWDIQSGQSIAAFEYHFDSAQQEVTPDYFVSFAVDGRHPLSANHDGPLRVWNLTSGYLSRIVSDADSRYEGAAISPDGGTFAGSSWRSSSLELWNVAKGELIKKIKSPQGTPHPLVFSPDGKALLVKTVSGKGLALLNLLSGTMGREILINDDWLASYNCEFSTCAGHAVSFSPDGQTIILGGSDSAVRFLDVKSGKVFRRFVGHTGPIIAAALSADGKRLVSTSSDRTIKFWDSATGELLASTVVFQDNEWITITPEGFFDASANGGKNLNAVQGEAAHSIDQFYDMLHRPDLVAQKLAGDPQGAVKAAASKIDLDRVASSGDPPAVQFTTAGPIAVNAAAISIDATVVDRGGGIGRIEWRNNGKTIEIDVASGAGAKTAGRALTLRKSVSLIPGDNVIEIKAYNGENKIESTPAKIAVKRATAQPQVNRPRLFVLAVGVNNYWDSKLHLNFAVPDAKSMAAGFQQAKGGLYEQVNVTTLLDADVSQAGIDRIFADLKNKVQPQDVFVFFLSGHGKTEDGKFYYLPQDFKYNGDQSIIQGAVSHEKLKAWFTEILAQKQVLLFDACESGALIQQQIAMRGLEEKTALDQLVRGTGATVLTATTDDKPAAEGLHQHGVFTYAVLRAFAEADANGDGYVDVQELANYVFNEVPSLTEAAWGIRQVPQMNVVGSIYPLVTKTKILEATAEDPSTVISDAPTHVVIAATTVRQAASASSNAISELSPGMQIRLVKMSGGWVLVAREGKLLGYIDAKSVAALQ